MLSRVLSQMLDELKTCREEDQIDSKEIEQRLNCLEFDLKWLIRILKESQIKRVA